MENKETQVGFAHYPTRTKVLYVVLAAVVVITAAAWVWYLQGKNQTSAPTGSGVIPLVNDQEQSATPATSFSQSDAYIPPVLPEGQPDGAPEANATVQWKTPHQIGDQHLLIGRANGDGTMIPLAEGNSSNDDWVKYYEIGSRGSNQIILAQTPIMGLGVSNGSYFFEKVGNGYTIMLAMSNLEMYRGESQPYGVVISNRVNNSDIKTFYRGIVGPANLSYNGIALNQSYLFPTDFFKNFKDPYAKDENTTVKKVATLSAGDLYEHKQLRFNSAEGANPEKFYVTRYVIALPSGFYTSYNTKFNFLSDNNIPSITWSDGAKNADPYRIDAALGGCGMSGSYVTSVRDISSAMQVAGTTSTGVTVYEFNDVNNPVLRYFYDLMGGQRFDPEKQQMAPISVEEWFKHHPIIAVKNAAGQYMLMSSQTYGLAAECGKPVVYLYPTKNTKVNVQVGADVTKSEPNYGKGWTVNAQPNGSLLNLADGQTYESLFWEGLGHGNYPQIESGFVVKQEELITTIRAQLAQQGLNQKESDDFMEFWQDRFPTTPYVRLTWFTTSQMDTLAPLKVTPRPDTVIRVFLDFQGLQQPVNLPSQQLSSIPRKGFTVIEWGGLLR